MPILNNYYNLPINTKPNGIVDDTTTVLSILQDMAIAINTVIAATIAADVDLIVPNHYAPTTGGTVNASALTGNNRLNIVPATGLAALTLTLPTTPVDQQVLDVHITQDITALTVTGGTIAGQASGLPVVAGFSQTLIYSLTDLLWV
jgi:hypothetical protein